MKRQSLAVALLTFAFAPAIHATPIVDWSFENPWGVVRTSDTVSVYSTITNVGDSALTLANFGLGIPVDTFGAEYDFYWGNGQPNGYNNLISSLEGFQLNSGASLTILMGSFVPIGGQVPMGLYSTEPAIMSIAGEFFRTDNSFSRWAIRALPVPEPNTSVLLLISAVGLGFFVPCRSVGKRL